MSPSLGIVLQPADETPLYQQLYDQVTRRIRTGAWPPGFRLPATRQLARQLGTHRNTVVRAFEELQAAGYLVSTVGRGTFVAETPRRPDEAREAPAPRALPELPWGSLLSRAATAEPLVRLDRFRRDIAPGAAIDMTRLQPSHDLLPHEPMRRCLDHVMRRLGPLALGYAPREGVLALREQIAAELAHSGVPARPDDVLVTTGSQQALDLIFRALVNPGDRFLVDGATYTGALNLLALSGAQLVTVPGDGRGPDLAALRMLGQRDAKGLYLMPNNHNPTAACIGAARREELVAWSHQAGVPIIEDDYGADLELEPSPAPPHMRALDPEVIYVSTFSKKLIPALRLGFVVCPPSLRDRLCALKHAVDLGSSALLQHGLAEFLERGYLRAHFKRVLPEYRVRRDALVASLHRHLPPAVTFEVPKRGVVLWLALPPALDPETVYHAARREGVLVTPGTLHAAGGRVENGVRLTFCAEPPERLIEGARRLGRALRVQLERRPPRSPAAVMHGV
jgi:GntR family transcriptional regulator / MocR family aminotransferase